MSNLEDLRFAAVCTVAKGAVLFALVATAVALALIAEPRPPTAYDVAEMPRPNARRVDAVLDDGRECRCRCEVDRAVLGIDDGVPITGAFNTNDREGTR